MQSRHRGSLRWTVALVHTPERVRRSGYGSLMWKRVSAYTSISVYISVSILDLSIYDMCAYSQHARARATHRLLITHVETGECIYIYICIHLCIYTRSIYL